jgi:hypothetical protein
MAVEVVDMRRPVIACALLIVLLVSGVCSAASLTGARNYGLTVDAGVLEIRTGSTLDYELASNLYLTLDIQTRYSWVSKPLARYELSVNWYPDMWLFRGWCVSAGTAVRTEAGPQVFVEVSTPRSLSIPQWLRFWEK